MDIRNISHIKGPLGKSVMTHNGKTLHMGGRSKDTPLGWQLLTAALKLCVCAVRAHASNWIHLRLTI